MTAVCASNIHAHVPSCEHGDVVQLDMRTYSAATDHGKRCFDPAAAQRMWWWGHCSSVDGQSVTRAEFALPCCTACTVCAEQIPSPCKRQCFTTVALQLQYSGT